MVLFIQNIAFILLILFLVLVLKQRISSPSIAFILPFMISSIYLSFNASRWNVNLSITTTLVILGGSFSFLLGICFSNIICSLKKNRLIIAKNNRSIIEDIYVDKNILRFFCLFQSISIIIVFRAILMVSKKYGYVGKISQLIYGYRFLGTYTANDISLGIIGNTCYNIVTAAGFVWIYLLIHGIVNKKHISKELLINLTISLLMCLIKGGREKAIQILAAGFLYYLIFNKTKNNNQIELSSRQFVFVLIAGFAVLVSFQSLGKALGRTVQADFAQYIAVYLSGSIRNLDVYIRNPWRTTNVFGKMTFIRIINYLGKKLKIEKWTYPLDLPYQSANGNNSGNIYTTFYAYLYDFGYIGIIIMPLIIGFVTNIIYRIASTSIRRNSNKISLSLIVYGYLYYALLFSYFSNKFYEMTFSITFIRNIVIWVLLIYVLKTVRIGTIENRKVISL